MLQVLVVENNSSLAWLYREELEDLGFSVRVSSDLPSAMIALAAQPAHLVISDTSALGPRPRQALVKLKKCHTGPMLLLASGRKGPDCLAGVPVLHKTSDLGPLVRSVKGHVLQVFWGSAATC